MLKIPLAVIGSDRQNSVAMSRPVSPRFAARCLLQPEQRALVDGSRMIRIKMGSNTRSVNSRS
jgi:hypothetical protein